MTGNPKRSSGIVDSYQPTPLQNSDRSRLVEVQAFPLELSIRGVHVTVTDYSEGVGRC